MEPAPIVTVTPEAPTPPIQSSSPTPPVPPSEPTTTADPKDAVTAAAPFTAAEIKLPDGMTVADDIMAPFVELVNKHSIPRTVVDEIVALQVKSMQSNSEMGSRAWADMQTQWSAEIAADPEIGGQAWTKHEAVIGQMLDRYGTPGLRAALDLTGAGNNPEVVRFFAKMASTVTEPGFIPAPAPADGQRSVESRLYPSMKT